MAGHTAVDCLLMSEPKQVGLLLLLLSFHCMMRIQCQFQLLEGSSQVLALSAVNTSMGVHLI